MGNWIRSAGARFAARGRTPRKWFVRASIAAALPLLGMAAVAQVATAVDANGEYARGRLLVMPRAGVSDARFDQVLAEHGSKGRRIGQSRLYIVELPAGASEKGVAERLAHDPHVKFAELDRKVKESFAVNDPYASSEWHLAKIGAPAAWDTAQGASVTIAIIDSGVDTTHPDLAAQSVAGWNFVDGNSNTSDVRGHGTAVAGTAAATMNNGMGVAGVAGKSFVMPIRVSDSTGYATYSAICQGITYAADHGARVANVSFGGLAGVSSVLSSAQYMKNKNGLVFVSAGNSGGNEGYAQTTSLIPVSATDSNDVLASWSSYGPYVALSAPGQTIYTTEVGGGYGAWWGTSFSSPVAAGAAAVVMSANFSLSSSQVESILYSTAVDLGSAGRDLMYGYGRVNVAGAVQSAASTTVVTDTQPPTVAISAPLTGATVSGAVAVNVSASDNVGVSKVELRVNGALLATDTSTPYAFTLDSTKLANGTVSLVASAYDGAGNSAASAPVSISIANSVQSTTTPLVVSITNPTGGKVSGNVSVTTSAVDASSSTVSQWLYIDGVLKASGSGNKLTYRWSAAKAAPGTHTIQAVAKDVAGNQASSSVQVTR